MKILISILPWLFVLIFTVGWYGRFLGGETLKRMLGRIAGYWFLTGLIVVIDLIAAGRLGGDMGLPALFRDDPLNATWHSRAVWGACTATYLVGLVWTIIYIFLYLDPNNFQTLPPTGKPVGWKNRCNWATPCRDIARLTSVRGALAFLAGTTPPFLVLLLMIGISPLPVVGVPKQHPMTGLVEYGIGIILGAGAVVLLILSAWGIIGPMRWVREQLWIDWLRNKFWPYHQEEKVEAVADSMVWAVVCVNALLVLVSFTFSWLTGMMTPGFAIGLLLCLVALGYLILMAAPRPFRVPMLVVLVVYMGWSNSGVYKYQFPGLNRFENESYYVTEDPARKGPTTPAQALLKDLDVLAKWEAAWGKTHSGGAKPKLVLVAASGGGYRASFWTATVLDQIEAHSLTNRDMPGIAGQIRLIAGASGGMVGASYYVALRDAAASDGGRPPRGVVDTLQNETKLDSLSLVVRQLVQGDIPGIFIPSFVIPGGFQRTDRGTVFEDQWGTLDRTFVTSRANEETGAIPSLIVSPMMIETGGRLLISNLDVDGLVRPRADSGIEYVSSGFSLFEKFPGAQETFRLKTAARMSASFPYVLPAVSLPGVSRPTPKPLRIVDAGYYDNFGVNLAAAWAYKNRDWIVGHTSGLALIQINAFPREQDPTDPPAKEGKDGEIAPNPAEPGPPDTIGDVVAEKNRGAFQWLVSPLEGGASARDWSMFYRNEEQIRLLDDTFNNDPRLDPPFREKTQRFFERFVFTFSGQAAMNVIIAQRDIDDMAHNFTHNPNPDPEKKTPRDAMDELVKWWTGGLNNPATKVRPLTPVQTHRPNP